MRVVKLLFPILQRSRGVRHRRRRAIAETVVVLAVGVITAVVLWPFPHEWPEFTVLVFVWALGLFATLYLVGARALAVVATSIVAATALMTSPLRRVAADVTSVDGTVTCLSHADFVGAWVHPISGRGGGWASWAATPTKEYVANYSYEVPRRENFRLGVGCGGTTHNWGEDLVTPYVKPGKRNFVCDDRGQSGTVFHRCRVVT